MEQKTSEYDIDQIDSVNKIQDIGILNYIEEKAKTNDKYKTKLIELIKDYGAHGYKMDNFHNNNSIRVKLHELLIGYVVDNILIGKLYDKNRVFNTITTYYLHFIGELTNIHKDNWWLGERTEKVYNRILKKYQINTKMLDAENIKSIIFKSADKILDSIIQLKTQLENNNNKESTNEYSERIKNIANAILENTSAKAQFDELRDDIWMLYCSTKFIIENEITLTKEKLKKSLNNQSCIQSQITGPNKEYLDYLHNLNLNITTIKNFIKDIQDQMNQDKERGKKQIISNINVLKNFNKFKNNIKTKVQTRKEEERKEKENKNTNDRKYYHMFVDYTQKKMKQTNTWNLLTNDERNDIEKHIKKIEKGLNNINIRDSHDETMIDNYLMQSSRSTTSDSSQLLHCNSTNDQTKNTATFGKSNNIVINKQQTYDDKRNKSKQTQERTKIKKIDYEDRYNIKYIGSDYQKGQKNIHEGVQEQNKINSKKYAYLKAIEECETSIFARARKKQDTKNDYNSTFYPKNTFLKNNNKGENIFITQFPVNETGELHKRKEEKISQKRKEPLLKYDRWIKPPETKIYKNEKYQTNKKIKNLLKLIYNQEKQNLKKRGKYL